MLVNYDKMLKKIAEKLKIYKMIPARLAVRNVLVKKGIGYDKGRIVLSIPSKIRS